MTDSFTKASSDRANEIEAAYKALCDDIDETMVKAGRKSDSIRLIAVTKNYPPADIEVIQALGQVDLGENRVQEMLSKMDYFNERDNFFNWHMIGTLQRNKVRQIVGRVSFIHSIDSLSLLKEVEKRSFKAGCISQILLQVNISGETSKHGFEPDEIETILRQKSKLSHVVIRGLMTMAPHYDDPELCRPVFAETKKLQQDLSYRLEMPELDQLSMGMTNDYRQAIEEGSTMLRVGSAIFGPRYH